MEGKANIRDYIRKFVDLTEAEVEEFSVAFKEIKVKKRQFLVGSG